jgi:phenylpropionate dioxygenase-like ring-hydroxylating dioxygenase large terminal subunit
VTGTIDLRETGLSDGTTFDDLINTEDQTISLRLFSDPEIYERELKQIFTRSWILLAHESEVPSPGHYVSRSIGQDPVVITRDEDGQVRVLLNVCAHRGMQVCRAEYGRATTLRCPYHGWIYGLDGSLKGVPAEREIYGDRLDKTHFALLQARVEVFAGMVWACWDEQAPTLDDYLGDFKFYLDVSFNRSDSGMEVVGPPQRWVIPANWKFAADQFSGDAYHVITLHRSPMQLGLMGNIEDISAVLHGIDVSSPQGHGLRCIRTTYRAARSANPGLVERAATSDQLAQLAVALPPGMTVEMLDQVPRHLTPQQIDLLIQSAPGVGQIFPTAAFIIADTLAADGKRGSAISWRTWVPRSPAQMEVVYWCMVEKDAPDSVKRHMRKTATQVFMSSGLVDQDDAEVWSGTQRVIGGAMAQTRRSNFTGQLGINRPPDWPGGGLVYDGPSSDDNQWHWWLRYKDLMTQRHSR